MFKSVRPIIRHTQMLNNVRERNHLSFEADLVCNVSVIIKTLTQR